MLQIDLQEQLRSPSWMSLIWHLKRYAQLDEPLLILGERGTGKTLLASWVVRQSRRADRPLRTVDCAALSRELLASELFGHARGAFTGARAERAGLFEDAAGGTVLLEELGELPGDLQAAVLRVIQHGMIRRVGESRERRVDVRILATTNRDPEELRGDLLDRFWLRETIPALRERPADVPVLVDHFLRIIGQRLCEAGLCCVPPQLDEAAFELVCAYDWPGNSRQLLATLYQAAADACDGLIEVHHLQRLIGTFEPDPGLRLVRELMRDPPRLDRARLEAHGLSPDQAKHLLARARKMGLLVIHRHGRSTWYGPGPELGTDPDEAADDDGEPMPAECAAVA